MCQQIRLDFLVFHCRALALVGEEPFPLGSDPIVDFAGLPCLTFDAQHEDCLHLSNLGHVVLQNGADRDYFNIGPEVHHKIQLEVKHTHFARAVKLAKFCLQVEMSSDLMLCVRLLG